MKILSFIALVSGALLLVAGAPQSAAPAKPAGGQYILSGTITETKEVLSGIRPTEEMEKEWRRPKPAIKKTYYIRRGSTNKYTRKMYRVFKTDSAGNFTVKLPPGSWCIVEKPKRDRLKKPDYTAQNKQLRSFEQYQVGDQKCFDEWYAQCDATVEIKDKDITGFNFNIHYSWNPPCVSGGPIPQ